MWRVIETVAGVSAWKKDASAVGRWRIHENSPINGSSDRDGIAAAPVLILPIRATVLRLPLAELSNPKINALLNGDEPLHSLAVRNFSCVDVPF